MSYYLHNVPGRLRIKTPVAKGSHQQAKAIQRVLQSIQGVRETTINTLTGSVMIHYDPKVVSSEEILKALNHQDYFDSSQAITHDQYVQNMIAKISRFIWKVFFGTFIDEALEGSSLSIIRVLI